MDSDRAVERCRRWATIESLPLPLGVTWIPDENAYNFALYSKHAHSVTLLLYRPDSLREPILKVVLDPLRNKTGRVWHCRLQHELMSNATLYAYQVAGPLLGGWFERHAFDDSKVLLDPYAREIFFPPTMDRMAASRPGSNAGRAPLGLIPKDVPEERTSRLRNQHECDTIIYELHVGGFTGPYADFTGTGNTLHCANQAVRKMIMDSIRHWSLHMGVDGVDLTSVFTRAMDA